MTTTLIASDYEQSSASCLHHSLSSGSHKLNIPHRNYSVLSTLLSHHFTPAYRSTCFTNSSHLKTVLLLQNCLLGLSLASDLLSLAVFYLVLFSFFILFSVLVPSCWLWLSISFHVHINISHRLTSLSYLVINRIYHQFYLNALTD